MGTERRGEEGVTWARAAPTQATHPDVPDEQECGWCANPLRTLTRWGKRPRGCADHATHTRRGIGPCRPVRVPLRAPRRTHMRDSTAPQTGPSTPPRG